MPTLRRKTTGQKRTKQVSSSSSAPKVGKITEGGGDDLQAKVLPPDSSTQDVPDVHLEEPGGTLSELLSDPWKRLNTLYYIKNKDGIRVKFKPWPEQSEFYWGMHYLNVVLKARQRGMTTIIQLFMLDACLFNDDVNAGVIAHNREDAQKFFSDKIKFAYDNLPKSLRDKISARNDNANELSFSNGSSIRVGVSMRSGTLQYLHVSEFGKICAKYPEKAKEIKTGSLNTVAPGNIVTIESTAEGAHGDFYNISTLAEKNQLSDKELTDLDYKFFFFPWWRAPEYALDANVVLNQEDTEYFLELEQKHGIYLTAAQKAWYVKKRDEQGDISMKQEYPSIPEEAFRGIVEGAVYGKQMRQLRKDRRICVVPWLPHEPVNTFWDIGRDTTSIWFHQRVGPNNHFFDYYQEKNQSLQYFAYLLLQDQSERFHKYNYGGWYFPHDIVQVDFSAQTVVGEQKTRQQIAESLGMKPLYPVARILVLEEGLEMTRNVLPSCFFDEVRCEEGIKALESYRYLHDDKMETYRKEPMHNWASHAADAIRQYAQGYRTGRYVGVSPQDDKPLSRRTRLANRKDESEWRI